MLVGAPLAALGVGAFLSRKKGAERQPSEEEREAVRQALKQVGERRTGSSSDAFSENRRAPRLPCCLPVDLTTAFINLKAVITEVGLTGIQLRVDRLLGPDTLIQIAPRERSGGHLTVRVKRGRQKGHFFAVGAEFEAGADRVDWLVDLLVLAGAGRHLGRERRLSRRLSSNLTVQLRETDGTELTARLLNLSMRGAAVELEYPQELGRELLLKLPALNHRDALGLGSRVVGKHDREPIYHLEFLEEHARLKQRLAQFLEEL